MLRTAEADAKFVLWILGSEVLLVRGGRASRENAQHRGWWARGRLVMRWAKVIRGEPERGWPGTFLVAGGGGTACRGPGGCTAREVEVAKVE